MKRYYSIFLLIFMAMACYRPSPEPTFNMAVILPQDSMIMLMTEMQLVDGAVNLKAREGKPLADYASSYSQQVLEKHGVSKESFTESIRYYSFNIEMMDEIYEQVIINLSKMESEINKGS